MHSENLGKVLRVRCCGNLFFLYGGIQVDDNEFITWVGATQEHMNALDRLIEDRKLLKNLIENHLREFFDFEESEFNRDMSVISLKISNEYTHIRSEKLSELHMDWAIVINYDGYGIDSVAIEVYPFGVPNNEGEM